MAEWSFDTSIGTFARAEIRFISFLKGLNKHNTVNADINKARLTLYGRSMIIVELTSRAQKSVVASAFHSPPNLYLRIPCDQINLLYLLILYHNFS